MHCTIRRMRPTDLPELYRLLSDPEVMRYLEPPFTMEATQNFLAQAGLSDSPLIYAAENEAGVFLGYVIYHPYAEDSVELGWVLKRKYWGMGYASALTKLLLADASQRAKFAVVECIPAQAATRKVALKNGFVYCGRENGLDVYKKAFLKG